MTRSLLAALLLVGAAAAVPVARAGDAVPAGDGRDLSEIVRRRSEMQDEYDAAKAERAEAIRAAAKRARTGGEGVPGWRNASDWGVDVQSEAPAEAVVAETAPAEEKDDGDVGSTLVVVAGLGILLLLGLKVFAPGLVGRTR